MVHIIFFFCFVFIARDLSTATTCSPSSERYFGDTVNDIPNDILHSFAGWQHRCSVSVSVCESEDYICVFGLNVNICVSLQLVSAATAHISANGPYVHMLFIFFELIILLFQHIAGFFHIPFVACVLPVSFPCDTFTKLRSLSCLLILSSFFLPLCTYCVRCEINNETWIDLCA